MSQYWFPSFCETWWQNPPSTLQVLEILLFVCMRLTAHPWDSFAALQPLLLCSWIMTVKFIGFSLNANYQCLKSDILSTLKTEHHPLMSAEKPEDWTLDFAESDSWDEWALPLDWSLRLYCLDMWGNLLKALRLAHWKDNGKDNIPFLQQTIYCIIGSEDKHMEDRDGKGILNTWIGRTTPRVKRLQSCHQILVVEGLILDT